MISRADNQTPYQTINPYTQKHVDSFQLHTDAQLLAILATADATQRNRWSTSSMADRRAVLKKAAAVLREEHQYFAKIVTLEMGKLLSEAYGEVELSADILDYYADDGEAFLEPERLTVEHGEAYTESRPLGVVFCIEPWNFPYYQLARVAGPNLMLGNTLVVKHASNVPQCALAFEKLFLDAGAPVGTYTNVFLTNEQCATAIADRRVSGVALTGSERAGTAVAAEAGRALKKSTMELGGSDAFIVIDDADMDVAIKWGVWAG